MVAGDETDVTVVPGGIIFRKIIAKEAHNIAVSVLFEETVIAAFCLIVSKQSVVAVSVMFLREWTFCFRSFWT